VQEIIKLNHTSTNLAQYSWEVPLNFRQDGGFVVNILRGNMDDAKRKVA
jgi:hypothetical protein